MNCFSDTGDGRWYTVTVPKMFMITFFVRRACSVVLFVIARIVPRLKMLDSHRTHALGTLGCLKLILTTMHQHHLLLDDEADSLFGEGDLITDANLQARIYKRRM